MPARGLLIFDDGRGVWGPMTDLRPVFELRSGALTLRQRIERTLGQAATALRVPAPNAALWAAHSEVPVNQELRGESWLAVNGRWLGTAPGAQDVIALRPGEALVQSDGQLVAQDLSGDAASLWLRSGLPGAPPRTIAWRGAPLVTRPWDILGQLEHLLMADLAEAHLPPSVDSSRLDRAITLMNPRDIRVADDARVHPMVVLNAEKGPIVIDRHAVVGSFCVIAGPCYVGQHTIVSPHAHIRAGTAVGPHCVVAGEISFCIFQGLSNKAHTGYLGHTFVGEWANLGADTNVSNLKNTYGSVRVQLEKDRPAEDSKLSKHGPIIGDFVRTAIGTRLLTGAVIGTGSMLALAGFPPKFIERFSFCTDDGIRRYDVEKFIATARVMMQRRGAVLDEPLEARLRTLAQPDA